MVKYSVEHSHKISESQAYMLCAIANELHLIEQQLARIARKNELRNKTTKSG